MQLHQPQACTHFLHDTFDDAGTHDSINILLNHLDTQYIMIDHEGCMGKTLFSRIDVTPGGAFIQYIVT